jgi:hypothetical protein
VLESARRVERIKSKTPEEPQNQESGKESAERQNDKSDSKWEAIVRQRNKTTIQKEGKRRRTKKT